MNNILTILNSVLLLFITYKILNMAQDLTELTAAVAKDTEVDESAITLLNGLKQKLDDAIASNDPAALKALSDQLGSNAQRLADAVVANTPAEEGGGETGGEGEGTGGETPTARRR